MSGKALRLSEGRFQGIPLAIGEWHLICIYLFWPVEMQVAEHATVWNDHSAYWRLLQQRLQEPIIEKDIDRLCLQWGGG